MRSDVKPDRIIDARGKFCPVPLMELIKAIKEEEIGRIIEVWSSDRGSMKDIPQWVEKAGHELIGVFEEKKGGYYRILVRKSK